MQFDTVKWVHVAAALPITTRGAVQPSPYNPLPAAGGGCGAPLMGLKLLARRQETPDVVTFEFAVPPAEPQARSGLYVVIALRVAAFRQATAVAAVAAATLPLKLLHAQVPQVQAISFLQSACPFCGSA